MSEDKCSRLKRARFSSLFFQLFLLDCRRVIHQGGFMQNENEEVALVLKVVLLAAGLIFFCFFVLLVLCR